MRSRVIFISFITLLFHWTLIQGQEYKFLNEPVAGIEANKFGATHCTGDTRIKMIREAFGENYIGLGAGNTIVIN